jgi:hypothetical protein
VFTFRDPRPFFADMGFAVRNAARRVAVLWRRPDGDQRDRPAAAPDCRGPS